MSLVPGQGHFGPDAIPGVRLHTPLAVAHAARVRPRRSPALRARQDARWRRGESVSLKTARDSMVGLELAQHAQMVYSKA